MVQIVHILSRIKHLIPYGSITHLHTEYINWHIGAFVHLYIIIYTVIQTSVPLPVHVYLNTKVFMKTKTFSKFVLKKCSYLKVEVHGIQINHI